MFKNILKDSFQAGLFQKKYWPRNILSGLIVGIVALPLAMAFAIASGAKPEQGLYTAIIAGFIVSVFGGSRVQIAGPTGAFIVILSAITAQYGIEGLQLASLMAGFILIFMGLARFGAVIKFIPYPVITGFTAGIAIVIWVGQWPAFFGIPSPQGAHFHEKLWHTLLALQNIDLPTTYMGVLSLIVALFVNKIPGLKKIPAPLFVLLIATATQSFFHFASIATIGSAFGGIPQGLPHFQLPTITFDKIIELIGPAFTIAMLGSIESLLSAVVADGMSNTKHHSNQELIGQGLANIAAPLFGGFAATGAIARTATNIRNGANSPLAGIIHCLTLVLILIFLAPLAQNIPLAALAAILFIVAWNMSEVKHVIKLFKRAPRSDIVILSVTLLLTIFVDLVMAVNIGVILAILHFLLRMASSVEIEQETTESLSEELHREKLQALPDDVVVYSVEGPFFFGAVEAFETALAHTHTDPHILIIRFRWVPFIDITGMQALEEAVRNLHKRNIRVIISGIRPNVANKLKKAGILTLLGHENIFGEFKDALAVAFTK